MLTVNSAANSGPSDDSAAASPEACECFDLGHGLSLAVGHGAARPLSRGLILSEQLMLTVCLEYGSSARKRSNNTRLSSGHCAVQGISNDEDLVAPCEPGQALKWISVFIERQALFEVTGLCSEDLPDDINRFLADGTGLPTQSFTLSPATTLIARQIVDCPYKNGFLLAFLKAKALELTCDILHALAKNLQESRLGSVQLSPRDHRKLKQAMAFIDNTLEQAPDIDKLVAAVGISRPKLQLGFRLLYGDTVARVRDKRRMELALRLVRSTQLSMVDIAAEVGYEHAASFTRAFKAAYGDAPLKLRRAAQHSSLLAHLA